MGDVLTQSQIDALLASAISGDVEEEKKADDYSHLRKYDFHSPKKFTKDRLKLVNSVYENYARIISSYLTSLLRGSFKMDLLEVEEQRYYEVNNSLTESDIVAMLSTVLDNDDEGDGEPVMMQFSNSIMHAMIERMLGGTGDLDDEDFEGYTEIELSLYESIVKHMVPVMKETWSNYLDLDFHFTKVEPNPKLIQNIGVDEIVIIVLFNLEFREMKGTLNICLPGSLVENIFKSFDKAMEAGNKRKEHQNEKSPEAIFENLKDTSLTIEAKLGKAEIMFSDMYHLKVGDILNLGKHKDSDILLYIEDEPWFKGKLGVQKGNMAVKIKASAARD